MITNQRDLRRAFWEQHPGLDRRRITDYSGNGKHQVRSSDDTRRPLLKTTAGPNSKPTLRFDGSNDNMNCNGTTIVIPTNWSLYVVAKAAASATQQGPIASDAFDQATQIFQMAFLTTATARITVYGGAGTGSKAMDATGAFHLYEAIRDTNSIKLYVDKVLEESNATVGTNASGTQGVTLGCNGNIISMTNTFNGDVCFAGLYTGALSDADRLAIQNFVAEEYALFAVEGGGGGAAKGGGAKGSGGRKGGGGNKLEVSTGGAESHLIIGEL